jgi:hypothetical protein
MTVKAIPLPYLGTYAGSELLMDSPGFTLDGQGLLVRVGYFAASSLRHAAWVYDIKSGSYSLDINAQLALASGQTSSDLGTVEIHSVQAVAPAGQQGVAVLYSLPDLGSDRQIALILDGAVSSIDLLGELPAGKITRFAMSSDSRFLAVQTDSAVMEQVTDANQGDDIYLLDRQTGDYTRVSAIADDDPVLPSQLGALELQDGQVRISFISEYAYSAKDRNGESGQAGDAYLWSLGYHAGGFSGQPTVTLLSGSETAAIGGMTVSADGQPEFDGPLITASGVYFNSSSLQLALNDDNNAADAFVYAGNQAKRLTWNQQPLLDSGATVVDASQGGEILALLSASSALAGSYGSTVLMVLDTRSGNFTVLPANLATADGAVLSASLSPNGGRAAFTSNASTPLAGPSTLIEGTLYLVETGWSVDREATGSVTLTGTAAQGQTIGASVNALSDEDGDVVVAAYQWQRSVDGISWTAIDGANAGTYGVAADQSEVGRYLRVRLLIQDTSGGTTELFSDPQVVANVNDAPTGSVSITGTFKQGQLLTASNSLVDLDGIPTTGVGAIGYQWKANGSDIAGAIASSYTLTQAEVGKTITVTASYFDLGGAQESVTSVASAAVLPLNTGPTLATPKFWKNPIKVPSEVNKAAAVNLTDAIGILKMIVGLPVNSNNVPLSPYQSIAADFDQSGEVNLTDAIGVLKMVVGLSAPAPAWKYFDDAKLAASYKAAAALSPKGWSASAALTDPTTVPIDVKLIGVLTGDVDGNWAGS